MPRAKRRLGQHFLYDPRILTRIAAATGAGPGDTVLEIGPGPGGLTAALAARVPGAIVAEGDALELDWHAIAGTDRFILAGNIPYNITSPLIDKALAAPLPRRVVFLVQKEVADRVAAPPGQRSYGALSVGVQAAARVERLFGVPAGAFHPPPKVDSAVLRLTPLDQPLVSTADRAGFRRMVVALFGFRRKQLLRAVRELTGWTAEPSRSLLAASAVAETARVEILSPRELAVLYDRLVDAGWCPD